MTRLDLLADLNNYIEKHKSAASCQRKCSFSLTKAARNKNECITSQNLRMEFNSCLQVTDLDDQLALIDLKTHLPDDKEKKVINYNLEGLRQRHTAATSKIIMNDKVLDEDVVLQEQERNDHHHHLIMMDPIELFGSFSNPPVLREGQKAARQSLQEYIYAANAARKVLQRCNKHIITKARTTTAHSSCKKKEEDNDVESSSTTTIAQCKSSSK